MSNYLLSTMADHRAVDAAKLEAVCLSFGTTTEFVSRSSSRSRRTGLAEGTTHRGSGRDHHLARRLCLTSCAGDGLMLAILNGTLDQLIVS